MPKPITRRDIPDSKVDEVVKIFEDDECSVERIEQPDGLWTVIATPSDS